MKKMVIVVVAMMMVMTMSMTAFAKSDKPTETAKQPWYKVGITAVCDAGTAVADGVVTAGKTVAGGAVKAGTGAKHGLGHAFIWCSDKEEKIGNWLLK